MTIRLVQIVANHWPDIDGEAALNGQPDPLDLPIDRLCNLGWYYATRNAQNENDLRKFENRLWIPPPDEDEEIDAASPWSAENETSAFKSLKASLNMKDPSTAGPSDEQGSSQTNDQGRSRTTTRPPPQRPSGLARGRQGHTR